MKAVALLLAALAASARAAGDGPYWLQSYAPPAYHEILNAELEVKSLDAVEKIVAAIQKNGGKLTQPLAVFARSDKYGEQQLSFELERAKAPALLKALRKVGRLSEPVSRPAGEIVPLDEVRRKLARLSREKAEKGALLAQLPATAEAVDELIASLSTVEAEVQTAEGRELWNVTVRARR